MAPPKFNCPLIGVTLMLILLTFGRNTLVFGEEGNNSLVKETGRELMQSDSESKSHVSTNAAKFNQINKALDSLKNVTEQLQKGLMELRAAHSTLEKEVHEKFAEVQNQLTDLTGKVNITIMPTVDIHHRISQLQQKHDALASSVSTIHNSMTSLAQMYNITERLQATADLLLQERWSEVMIHWTFVEKHTLDYDAMSGYLQTVVRLAYTQHRNLSSLISIFKFVQKISLMDYKVFAYEMLVQQLLDPQNSDIFDGSEIIILSHYVGRHYGVNSKGYSRIPMLAKLISYGANVRFLYLENNQTSTTKMEEEQSNSLKIRTGPKSDRERRKKRAAKGPKGPKKIVPKRLRPANSLDIHPKADMVTSRKDAHLSFAFPVFGSPSGSFKPKESAFWSFHLKDDGFFTIQNQITFAYLMVPRLSVNVTTVRDADPMKYGDNVHWKIRYIDGETLGVECKAFPGRPLKAVMLTRGTETDSDSSSERMDNKVSDQGPSVVFQVDEDPAQTYDQGTGAKFTVMAD